MLQPATFGYDAVRQMVYGPSDPSRRLMRPRIAFLELARLALAGVLALAALPAWAQDGGVEQQVQSLEQDLRHAQIQVARHRASIATDLLAEGDAGAALAVALSAMPQANPSGWPDLADIPQVSTTLYDALVARRELTVLRGHTGGVDSAAFSPDGARILTGSWDGTARIWDTASGETILVLHGHSRLIASAAFSPDGTRILTEDGRPLRTSLGQPINSDQAVRIWDAATGTEIATLSVPEEALPFAAFSPDGERVVTASLEGARVWDVESGNMLAHMRGHIRTVSSASFSPDGERVLTASPDGTARIWDAASGAQLLILRGHEPTAWPYASILTAVFSPDGTRILTTSYDQTARVWDAATGAQLMVLQHHDVHDLRAGFSPDGELIVTYADTGRTIEWDSTADRSTSTLTGGTTRVWDAASGIEIAASSGHESWVVSAVFSPDSRQIVTASSDGTARLWDAMSGASIGVLRGHEDEVESAAFSPDGRYAITASKDGTARIWQTTSGIETAVLRGHELSPDTSAFLVFGDPIGAGVVESAAFSPDGTRVVTASWDGTARIWNALNGDEMVILRGHEHIVTFADFSDDGRRIVTASYDLTLRIWDAATGAEIAIVQGHARTEPQCDPIPVGPGHAPVVVAAAVSTDGTQVAGGICLTTRVWDAATGREIALLEGHEGPVQSVAFSPDGTEIVTASLDGTARVWNAVDGNEIVVLSGHEQPIRSADFSPDGKRVVTYAADRVVRVWDASSGVEQFALVAGQRIDGFAAFSPDGHQIVAAIGDEVVFWDAASGSELARLTGHLRGITHLDFSPDMARIVTASSDDTARVWDVASGQTVAILHHANIVSSAAFSPDGSRVVTASRDATARVWLHSRTMDELYEYARDIVDHLQPLTEEEACTYHLQIEGCGP